ncbi:hypothetical protein RBH29_07825 [Herbivorax sp. ANBcel31]|uniref:hypothetical protein n=1 Tax=Herbivorax sp. ANBcel31 TaxID=3069754 RepID=UPI0027B49C63|nr:hypothetical protein [Herbivorax sp. ANBcel31]MDQ2086336.1 hypothetical protein [Herbivorax sp. ANBcel31]
MATLVRWGHPTSYIKSSHAKVRRVKSKEVNPHHSFLPSAFALRLKAVVTGRRYVTDSARFFLKNICEKLERLE